MRRHLGHAGEPHPGAGSEEGIAFVAAQVGSRQRLLLCLALSALLHFLLTLSVGPGAAGPMRAAPGPAANGVLHGMLLPRVSAKGDGGSNKVPTRKAPDTAPPEPNGHGFEKTPLIMKSMPVSLTPNPLDEPYYFRASELEVRPRVLSDVQPRFPPSAEGAVAGKMVLRLRIDEAGGVDGVLVEHSELPQAFQDLAVEAFSSAVFAPGEIGEIAVKSQMLIEVTYEQAE